MRKAKTELLSIKKERDKEIKNALEFKKEIKEAVDKGDKRSIAHSVMPESDIYG